MGVVRGGKEFDFRVKEDLAASDGLVSRTLLVTLPDGARHGYSIARDVPTAHGSTIDLPGDPGWRPIATESAGRAKQPPGARIEHDVNHERCSY